MKKILTVTGLTTTAIFPLAAFAQPVPIGNAPQDFCGILKIGSLVATWFGIIVFILAIIAMLYAAFLYLTGGGEEEKLKTAKTVLIYGVVGIAIALLATNAVNIIGATVGGETFRPDTCQARAQ